MANPDNSISIATGSLVVSGAVTAFKAAEWDILHVGNMAVPIEFQVSTSELRLKYPWPGPDVVGRLDWRINNCGPYWTSAGTVARRINDLLDKMEAGPIKWDAAGTLAERDDYNGQPVGFLYLAIEPDAVWTLYTKLANFGLPTDWSTGQALVLTPTITEEARASRDDAVAAAAAADADAAAAAQSKADAAAIYQQVLATPQAVNSATVTGKALLSAASAAAAATAIGLGAASNVSFRTLEVGRTDGTASTPFIDFHSSGNNTDYDARILGSGGNATVGRGNLTFYAGSASFTGSISAVGSYTLDGAAGSFRTIYFRSDSVNRWTIYINNTAESGGNAGSNFRISRFADDGSTLGDPLYIDRASGRTGVIELAINQAAGNDRRVIYQSNGTTRWTAGASPAAETGSNAGSNFNIARYSDAGAFIDTPLTIDRANARTTFTEMALSKPAATPRVFWFQSGGSHRWSLSLSEEAEAGSNAASDFRISRYSDAASLLDRPLVIERSSGRTTVTDLAISKPAATTRALWFQSAGANRWSINISTGAESGSNAGSDFRISRYSDAGAGVDEPLSINRATGRTTLTDLTVTGDTRMQGTVNHIIPAALTGFRLQGSGKTSKIEIHSWLTNSAYNALSQVDDQGIFFYGSAVDSNTAKGFVIAPWSASAAGVRMDYTGKVGFNKSNPVVAVDVVGAIAATAGVSVGTTLQLGSYTVATVPAGTAGMMIYVSNARKNGEAAGAGTGVAAYYSGGSWRRTSDDTAIAA
ncbi:hypothetical protein [Methylobacterium sp. ID0610]|uniref:hypothetical protein n=1 Tax=Methylobacterium carpenticola TaxID=3344827 RepID=UPI0036B129A3